MASTAGDQGNKPANTASHSGSDKPFAILAIAVLGVVYGDIGTSPLPHSQTMDIGVTVGI